MKKTGKTNKKKSQKKNHDEKKLAEPVELENIETVATENTTFQRERGSAISLYESANVEEVPNNEIT